MKIEMEGTDDIFVAISLIRMWAMEQIRNRRNWGPSEVVEFSPALVVVFNRIFDRDGITTNYNAKLFRTNELREPIYEAPYIVLI